MKHSFWKRIWLWICCEPGAFDHVDPIDLSNTIRVIDMDKQITMLDPDTSAFVTMLERLNARPRGVMHTLVVPDVPHVPKVGSYVEWGDTVLKVLAISRDWDSHAVRDDWFSDRPGKVRVHLGHELDTGPVTVTWLTDPAAKIEWLEDPLFPRQIPNKRRRPCERSS